MDATTRTRWFHLTPGRFVLALLAVEVLLWLSETFGWLPWHKGYAVLTCVVAVGVAFLLMLLWFAVALVFRRRFQFGISMLLVLTIAVAVPSSWLAVETKEAKRQCEAVEAIRKWAEIYCLGSIRYDYQLDVSGKPLGNVQTPGPEWLRRVFGDDFLADVEVVWLGADDHFTDVEMAHIASLPRLKELHLSANGFNPFRTARSRSKRSRFITLFHAATKSRTNFSCESWWP